VNGRSNEVGMSWLLDVVELEIKKLKLVLSIVHEKK